MSFLDKTGLARLWEHIVARLDKKAGKEELAEIETSLSAEVGSAKIPEDWNQNDPTAPDYIKNRTHYEETVEVYGDTLTWDGNTEGLEKITMLNGDEFYRVSNAVLSETDLLNGFSIGSTIYGEVVDFPYSEGNVIAISGVLMLGEENILVIPADNHNLIMDGQVVMTFSKKGTYFVNMDGYYITSLAIPGYAGFKTTTTTVKTIDPKYLPESVGGSDGASIDVTAEVGQAIVVEEVDANGKPTKWKAADYQEKICGIGEEEVIYEDVIEINPEEGVALRDTTFVPTAGETYKISWNGTEYSCVAVEVLTDMGVTIIMGNGATGDIGIMDDTGEPFTLGFAQGAALVAPLDGSTQVSLIIAKSAITKIPTKFVPTLEEMRSEFTEELVPLTEFTPVVNESLGVPMADLPSFKVEPGKMYEVTFDEVRYVCKATFAVAQGMPIILIGNQQAAGGENSGEPFAIALMLANGYCGIVVFDTNPHSVRVVGEVVHQIPHQYIEPFYINIKDDPNDSEKRVCDADPKQLFEVLVSGGEISVIGVYGLVTDYLYLAKKAFLTLEEATLYQLELIDLFNNTRCTLAVGYTVGGEWFTEVTKY